MSDHPFSLAVQNGPSSFRGRPRERAAECPLYSEQRRSPADLTEGVWWFAANVTAGGEGSVVYHSRYCVSPWMEFTGRPTVHPGMMKLHMMPDKGMGTMGAVCLDGSDAGFYFSKVPSEHKRSLQEVGRATDWWSLLHRRRAKTTRTTGSCTSRVAGGATIRWIATGAAVAISALARIGAAIAQWAAS